MNIQIKAIEPNEIDAFLSMMKNFYSIDNYSFDADVAKRTALELVENEQLGRLYIIKENIDYVGYIVLTFGFSFEYDGRGGFIDEFFVEENWRNKGIGKLALAFIAKQANKFGVNALYLQVEKHNQKAFELYRKNEFKANDRILMTKVLS